MKADPNAKLVAMGDLFRDRLDSSKTVLQSEGGSKFDVTEDRCFTGWDAFLHVIAVSDLVLLATPPHFRPMHLRAAVEAGKHVFFEKPVAVDAPGVRSVIESGKIAKQKGLSLCSGFCYRFHPGTRELMNRVHGGVIGDLISLQVNYNTGYLWNKPRTPEMTDMEWQLRNWLYFTWLSGDHIVEQHVHSLDKAMWAMNGKLPARAVGLGGRQARTAPEFGNIFDHHAVCYEFEGGVRCFSYCRQQDGTSGEDADYFFGSKGVGVNKGFGTQEIRGQNAWRFKGKGDAYFSEHKEHMASIRAGQPMNLAEAAARSTLMAIMGRMSTYTGKAITWDMAMNSTEDLTPPKYEFGPLPTPPVAIPGVTKFI
jgi:predicted dehydrogenase